MSDIIEFRKLIENGYSISQINTNDLGQTVIKFTCSNECHTIEEKFYYFITQDHAVIQKAHEIAKK